MSNPAPSELLSRAFHRDLRLFSSHPNHQRALLFPPLNSFNRFCLHNLVKENYPDVLTSFSVGEDKERRTVVAHQDAVAHQVLQELKQKAQPAANVETQSKEDDLADVGKLSEPCPAEDPVTKIEKPSKTGKTKQARRPDRAVYAPPGARRSLGLGSTLGPKAPSRATPRPDLPPYRQEIEAILGPVRLISPSHDFLALESGCVTSDDVVDEELPNVVEMYDFPEDYKTDDLENCLHRSLSLTNYYELKWVDSTHALVIFPDDEIANRACHIEDSFIKFRPFWAASKQSICLARMLNLSTESTRSKPRPDSSTATAKRLLARALGMPALSGN